MFVVVLRLFRLGFRVFGCFLVLFRGISLCGEGFYSGSMRIEYVFFGFFVVWVVFFIRVSILGLLFFRKGVTIRTLFLLF